MSAMLFFSPAAAKASPLPSMMATLTFGIVTYFTYAQFTWISQFLWITSI